MPVRRRSRPQREHDERSPDQAIADEPTAIVAAQQDPAKFAPLYAHYHPLVVGYCYRRVGTLEQAEDIAQQVFVRVLRNLPSYRPVAGASFRSWIFTIAHNAIIDHRRRTRDIGSYDRDATLQPVDRAPLPVDLVLRDERKQQMLDAISRLSPGQRAVVELRLAGLKGREIAETLDMSLGAVKSAQLRAFATLRTLLDTPENDDAIR
jgi:RNA polymerase sigma-70 factor (ECF subfamily)